MEIRPIPPVTQRVLLTLLGHPVTSSTSPSHSPPLAAFTSERNEASSKVPLWLLKARPCRVGGNRHLLLLLPLLLLLLPIATRDRLRAAYDAPLKTKQSKT